MIVGANAKLRERMAFLQNAVGAAQKPFDSFLALRGVKTLALWSGNRLRRCASRIGTLSIPGSTAAIIQTLSPTRSMRWRAGRCALGAMIAVEVASSSDDARRFLERCRVFTLAESLGGVESLISLPALMIHASTPREVRAALGISDRLVRISVGIEDGDELIADLRAALY